VGAQQETNMNFCSTFATGLNEEHRFTVNSAGQVSDSVSTRCTDGEFYEIVMHAGNFAQEISWTIGDHCESEVYESHQEYTKYCCVPPNSQLTCMDEYGDGWRGSYIAIGGVTFCDTFDAGTMQSFILNQQTLATTKTPTKTPTMTTTTTPGRICDFGFEGDDCEISVEYVQTDFEFSGMDLKEFERVKDAILEAVARELGVTIGDVRFGEVVSDTGRRRLNTLLVPVQAEVTQGSSRDGLIDQLNSDDFQNGVSDSVTTLVPGVLINFNVREDLNLQAAWPMTITFTGVMGQTIVNKQSEIMSTTADFVGAESWVYRAIVEGTMSNDLTRLRFDLSGNADQMAASVETCEQVAYLKSRIAGIQDLLNIEVTEVATNKILSCVDPVDPTNNPVVTCVEPLDTTGYSFADDFTCTSAACDASKVSCEDGYSGPAQVRCLSSGVMELHGCSSSVCENALSDENYNVPADFVCKVDDCDASGIRCKDGYTGTATATCDPATGYYRLSGCEEGGARTVSTSDDESWAEEHVETIIVGVLLVLILLVCVVAYFVCMKKPEKVYVQTMPAQPRMEMTDFSTVQRSYAHAGVTPSLRTVETLHPIEQRSQKRTPDPVQPRSVPVRSNMNSQYQITNNQVTDVSAMYGDVLYGDVTPAGPDGLNSVITGGANLEGSTVNANRIKNSSPNMGGHVAPDDDFEGDIGTL
jgi:hypothetical protein